MIKDDNIKVSRTSFNYYSGFMYSLRVPVINFMLFTCINQINFKSVL